ncbi:39S ribosomal protein L2, mitochondrial [Papilio machaon]|uniref:39S ribosomal protein L2, mitochondrial n=1 Tax=Papilio machaon TaxID=76193 RepID=A0A0N1I753_PAPMA|nr:39S ribosomal protein L2, mitochondrial [Papilio machaon]
MALNKLFTGLTLTSTSIARRTIQTSCYNFASKPNIEKPKPGFGKSYRRIVHFPEEYTVKPLNVTNLAGRDPVTGRLVAKGIGGGIKHKYHWIDWYRKGPTEGPPQEEKVIQIMEDGCRTSHIALVAVGDKLKYILATENMKAGDIIKTSCHLPRIPVKANEGDAYPLGALPTGTLVHCIEKEPGRLVAKGIGGGIKHKYHWIDWYRKGPTEGPPQEEKVIQIMEDGCRTSHIALVAVGDKLKYILATENMKAGDIIKTSCHLPRIPVKANEGDAYPLGALPTGTLVHCIEKEPGMGGLYIHAAGTFGTILRKQDERIIVQMPSKRLFSFDQHCMAVVGRLSNVDHGDTPIGSPQRNRWLGNRPRSGLWKRKDGRHGRKIKPPKPIKEISLSNKKQLKAITLSMCP